MIGRAAGVGAIALGVGLNLPYAALVALYAYPDILRRPAAEALRRFAEGGPTLIAAWYGFMLAALALIPVAIAVSITPSRLANRPALAIGAALAGALAGLAQAIGLARWIFVIPALAQAPADSGATFDILNSYGGVAIGEHIGQLLTALFMAQVASLQCAEGASRLGVVGLSSAVVIAIGTGEGLALALGTDGDLFGLATIVGFLGLSLWLVATGMAALRRPQQNF